MASLRFDNLPSGYTNLTGTISDVRPKQPMTLEQMEIFIADVRNRMEKAIAEGKAVECVLAFDLDEREADGYKLRTLDGSVHITIDIPKD